MNASRLKILLVNNYFYLRGGTERYCFGLADLLAKRGWGIVHFSTKNPLNLPSPFAGYFAEQFDTDAVMSLSPLGKLRAGGRIVYSFDAKKRIASLLDATRPSVAHCNNIYFALSPSILDAFEERGVPVVMTVHDMNLLCPNHRMYIRSALCERCKVDRFYNCAFNKCIADSRTASLAACAASYIHRAMGIYRKKIDAFISPSEFYERKLMEYGYPGERIHKIANFIDVGEYVPSYEHKGYAIYFGWLDETKGLHIILNAAAELKGVIDFVLVGDGPMRRDIQDAVAKFDLANIRLVGRASQRELIELVRGAMFSVVPSRWYENCPYAILESYALGKAVVGSDIGGIPEMIDDGTTGLLFDVSDARDFIAKVASLAQNPDRAMEMGRAARDKAEREYGPEIYYDELSSVYEGLTHRG